MKRKKRKKERKKERKEEKASLYYLVRSGGIGWFK